MLLFNTFTTISYAFLPVMGKNLYAALVKDCMPSGMLLVFHVAVTTLKCITHLLIVLTSTVWSPEMFSKNQ